MIEAVLCKKGPNIVKGESHIMRYGRTIVVMFPLLTLALFLMGCPKGSVTGLGTTGAVSVAANPGVGLTADGRMPHAQRPRRERNGRQRSAAG